MSRVSVYLNFPGTARQAFNFYKTVFRSEFGGDAVHMGETTNPNLSEKDKDLIMHIELPILSGHVLMGTDAARSLGQEVKSGNNISINLEPDKYAEAKRLFDLLSDDGQIETPLKKMFWGDYFASFTDKFGISWMINCKDKNSIH